MMMNFQKKIHIGERFQTLGNSQIFTWICSWKRIGSDVVILNGNPVGLNDNSVVVELITMEKIHSSIFVM